MFLLAMGRGFGVAWVKHVGGRGAVQYVLSGLHFLKDHCGFRFRLDSDLMPVHQATDSRQADPLLLRDLKCFEGMALSANAVVAFVSRMAACIAYGGVRFERAQPADQFSS